MSHLRAASMSFFLFADARFESSSSTWREGRLEGVTGNGADGRAGSDAKEKHQSLRNFSLPK